MCIFYRNTTKNKKDILIIRRINSEFTLLPRDNLLMPEE